MAGPGTRFRTGVFQPGHRDRRSRRPVRLGPGDWASSLKAPPPIPQAGAVAGEADPAKVTAARRPARSLAREFVTVNPLFGVAVVTADGQVFEEGDTRAEFAMESISKIFTMALAMEEVGARALPGESRRRPDGNGIQLHHGPRAARRLAAVSAGQRGSHRIGKPGPGGRRRRTLAQDPRRPECLRRAPARAQRGNQLLRAGHQLP